MTQPILVRRCYVERTCGTFGILNGFTQSFPPIYGLYTITWIKCLAKLGTKNPAPNVEELEVRISYRRTTFKMGDLRLLNWPRARSLYQKNTQVKLNFKEGSLNFLL